MAPKNNFPTLSQLSVLGGGGGGDQEGKCVFVILYFILFHSFSVYVCLLFLIQYCFFFNKKLDFYAVSDYPVTILIQIHE